MAAAQPFVDLLQQAGLKSYRRRKRYLRIRRPVTRGGGRQAHFDSARPTRFVLTCDVFYDHPLIGRQSLEMEVTPERYAQEIAPARTFGFEHDLDQMRDMGLIRGAIARQRHLLRRARRAKPRRPAVSRTSAAGTRRWT